MEPETRRIRGRRRKKIFKKSWKESKEAKDW
jgi:hypothetical protein